MAVYSVNTVHFRSVLDRIIWRRNTHRIWPFFPNFTGNIQWTVLQRIVTVNGRKYTVSYLFTTFILFHYSCYWLHSRSGWVLWTSYTMWTQGHFRHILKSFLSVKRAKIHFPPLFQVLQNMLFIHLNKYLLFNLSLKIT